jgi:hypothetical protein
MPDAVLIIQDTEFRLRAGDVRITVQVFANADVISTAAPVTEYLLPALSQEEIGSQMPALLEALYEVILGRPEYSGAELVGGTPEAGAYTANWAWDATTGAFHRGELRSDSNDWPNATVLTISTFSQGTGGDKTTVLLSLLKTGNRVQLQQVGTGTVRALYDITADATTGPDAESLVFSVSQVENSGDTPADSKSVHVSVLT